MFLLFYILPWLHLLINSHLGVWVYMLVFFFKSFLRLSTRSYCHNELRKLRCKEGKHEQTKQIIVSKESLLCEFFCVSLGHPFNCSFSHTGCNHIDSLLYELVCVSAWEMLFSHLLQSYGVSPVWTCFGISRSQTGENPFS